MSATSKVRQNLKVTAAREGNTITVQAEGSGKPFTFTVKGPESIVSVDGVSVIADGNSVSVPAVEGLVSFRIRLA